ncbi:uncharacterized protein LOC135221345 [Macrobrachium nipponense]|uniref:uncharacterized protein LOC135221345 n=1 Tax=Macrobrachium nipponense TaxID=159736 RepID=UPI0030C7E539
MTAITIALLAVVLTVSEFAYGQQLVDVYISEAREGMADFKKKQSEILEILNGTQFTALLSGFEDLQQKQNNLLANLSEMQKKLGQVENNLQGLHHDLELVKGAVNSNQDSLQKHNSTVLEEEECRLPTEEGGMASDE